MVNFKCLIYENLELARGKHSEESKKKISKSHTGLLKTEVHKAKLRTPKSLATKEKMSLAKKGKPLTTKHKENLTIARSINRHLDKSVSQYDLDGNFIATFPNLGTAAKAVNKSISLISACARGIRKTGARFLWKYA